MNGVADTRLAERAVFVLTSKQPFPPDDGQKIPVAAYCRAMEALGAKPEIAVLTQSRPKTVGATVAAALRRLNPFVGFHAAETLDPCLTERIVTADAPLVFVSPARLIQLAAPLKKLNPSTRIVLQLNDAKWPMYLEALTYGIGLRAGGAWVDLAKGLLTPITWAKERHAYRAADVVVVQTEREQARLPFLANKSVPAMNAIPTPGAVWHGQDSTSVGMQVNFSNRRTGKWRPFVEKVWPRIRAAHPELTLVLFGPGSDCVPAWVRAAPGVTYVGLIDDLDAFLAAQRMLLMPLEHTTGVSNMVLRGLAMDMPQVISESSSTGVHNLLGQHPATFVAQRPDDYLRCVDAALELEHNANPSPIGDWGNNLNRILEKVLA